MTEQDRFEGLLPAPISDDRLSEEMDRPAGPKWMPVDDFAAEWCAQKFLAARAEYQAIERDVATMRERVKQWADERLNYGRGRSLQRTMGFMTDRLEQYGLARRAFAAIDQDGESTAKTTSLPSATIRTHKTWLTRPKLQVEDFDALVRWLEENLDEHELATVAPRDVKLRALRDFVAVDADGIVRTHEGERVPGLEWDDGEPDVAANVTYVDEAVEEFEVAPIRGELEP